MWTHKCMEKNWWSMGEIGKESWRYHERTASAVLRLLNLDPHPTVEAASTNKCRWFSAFLSETHRNIIVSSGLSFRTCFHAELPKVGCWCVQSASSRESTRSARWWIRSAWGRHSRCCGSSRVSPLEECWPTWLENYQMWLQMLEPILWYFMYWSACWILDCYLIVTG